LRMDPAGFGRPATDLGTGPDWRPPGLRAGLPDAVGLRASPVVALPRRTPRPADLLPAAPRTTRLRPRLRCRHAGEPAAASSPTPHRRAPALDAGGEPRPALRVEPGLGNRRLSPGRSAVLRLRCRKR